MPAVVGGCAGIVGVDGTGVATPGWAGVIGVLGAGGAPPISEVPGGIVVGASGGHGTGTG